MTVCPSWLVYLSQSEEPPEHNVYSGCHAMHCGRRAVYSGCRAVHPDKSSILHSFIILTVKNCNFYAYGLQ